MIRCTKCRKEFEPKDNPFFCDDCTRPGTKWNDLTWGLKAAKADDNLGVSALKFGPFCMDTQPGSGSFFLNIDLWGLVGLKLRFNAQGWKAELPGANLRGDWS